MATCRRSTGCALAGSFGNTSRCSPSAAGRAMEAMRAAGFVELETKVTDRPPLTESGRVARERLLRYLAELSDPDGPALATELALLYRVRMEQGRVVTQVFARRPA